MRISRKYLPTAPPLHYMTGENANIRINITAHTGPLEVLETIRTGNIIAIIDALGFVRPILNSNEKVVQIITSHNNRVSIQTRQIIRRHGLDVYFNQRRS